MQKKRLVIVGIDGGNFEVIEDFSKKGILKNLNRLKNKSVLKSTMPPGTAVSWASFLTGNNPGKTEVYDFTMVDKDSWKINVVNKKMLKGKKLWEFLDESKIKSCYINLPLTYPPEKINGVMISGIDTPTKYHGFVYPPELKEFLKSVDYDIEVSGTLGKENIPSEALKILDARVKTAEKLIGEDFEFFIVLFRASDVVQHFAWDGKVLEEVYKKIDGFIGKVLDREDELIVMSDHGHEKVNKAVNINSWLEKENYLYTNIKKDKLSKIGINRERIFKILEKFRLNFLVKLVPRKLGKKIPTKSVGLEEAILTNKIEMLKTKVVAKRAVKTAQLYLNKVSRGGIVEDEKELIREVREKLERFFEKNKVSVEIYTNEEIYNNPSAPDITIYFKEKNYDCLTYLSSGGKLFDAPKENATHNTEGILFTNMNLNLEGPRIIDLMPTILDYFGIGGRGVDGRSLMERV